MFLLRYLGISFIDFDCTVWSKVGLAEFWAWREEEDGREIGARKERR